MGYDADMVVVDLDKEVKQRDEVLPWIAGNGWEFKDLSALHGILCGFSQQL